MPKNSSPLRHEPRPRKSAQPVERPLNAIIKYVEESCPMRLDEAMEYFSSCLPKAFRASEGVYSPKGREGVAKGDIFIVCLKKAASFLKCKSGNDPVTIPVVTRTEFALTPPIEEGSNETNAAVRNWEREFQSVTDFFEARKCQSLSMPAVLKVLDNALDHNGQKVPAKTILFNIHQVSQRVGLRKRCGIEGVDCSGVTHRFLEGEDPVHFSTRLFDVKCIPGYFSKVLQLPQTARVYLHPNTEEEEEVNLLQNLSSITITEVSHGHHLVVKKLSDGGDSLGPAFTVPWNADLKVVAIKLKDSHLLDSVSDQRCIVGTKSSPSIGLPNSQSDFQPNLYLDHPRISEAPRGRVQAGTKEDRDKETYYNMDTLRLRQYHEYVNVQVAVAFVPSHVSTGSTAAGASDQYVGDTELDDMRDGYECIPAALHEHHLSTCVESPEYTYVKVGIPTQGRPRAPPPRPTPHTKPKQHVPHPSQPPPVLLRPQTPDRYDENIYEEIVEDYSTHQRVVKSGQKLPQPQAPRSPSPVAPAHPDHSTKMKPKGVPSNAIPLTPFLSTHAPQPPRVHKKPIMLTSCPKELELHYHVAAKLGWDWRSVCTYLGLPLHQLDQADVAHSQLEDKAMQGLVMWLRRQEDPEAPHSWETLLQALRLARRNDLASDVERGIKKGTLKAVVANYK